MHCPVCNSPLPHTRPLMDNYTFFCPSCGETRRVTVSIDEIFKWDRETKAWVPDIPKEICNL